MIKSETIQKLKNRGWREGLIEIHHSSVDDYPGYIFELIETDSGSSITLFELEEKDFKYSNVHGIAANLAKELYNKLGLQIEINESVQGFPIYKDELAEKSLITRRVMHGIADDY